MLKYVAVGLIFCLPLAAAAQTGPGLLLEPLLSEDEVWESRGNATFLNQGSTSQDESYTMQIYQWSGKFREQRERFIPRVGWDLKYLDVDTPDPLLKNDLVDASIAAGLELGRYSKWTAGLTLGVGYAGNTPFGESDAWYGKATFVFGGAWNKNTDVVLVLDYDGNRSVYPDIPLPGFAIRHQYDPRLSWTLGVPVTAVKWKPLDRVTFDLTWTMIDSFDARLQYELASKWTVFGAWETRREAFSVDGLSNHDRLLFQQRRAEVGLLWKPLKHTSFQLAGGYAFSGEFSAGFDGSDSELVADLSDEPYVRVGFERQF
jgi:hypothetical protein